MKFTDFLSKGEPTSTHSSNLTEEFLFERSSKILNLPRELNGVDSSILGSKLTHFFIKFENSDWKKPLFAKVSYKVKDGQLADDITGSIEVNDIDYKNGEITNLYYMRTKNSAQNIDRKDLKKFIDGNKK